MQDINTFLIVVGLIFLLIGSLLILFAYISSGESGFSLTKEHNEFMDELIEHSSKICKTKRY